MVVIGGGLVMVSRLSRPRKCGVELRKIVRLEM